MRTLLISERRAAVNVNFAVTKLLALAPQHTADKHRLEGNNLLIVHCSMPTMFKSQQIDF